MSVISGGEMPGEDILEKRPRGMSYTDYARGNEKFIFITEIVHTVQFKKERKKH